MFTKRNKYYLLWSLGSRALCTRRSTGRTEITTYIDGNPGVAPALAFKLHPPPIHTTRPVATHLSYLLIPDLTFVMYILDYTVPPVFGVRMQFSKKKKKRVKGTRLSGLRVRPRFFLSVPRLTKSGSAGEKNKKERPSVS